jgi:hypothetical protein
VRKIRLLIGVPSRGTAPIGFTLSLVRMTNHVLRAGLPSCGSDEVSWTMRTAVGTQVFLNREVLAETALSMDTTHLLFLDDDMVFEPGLLDCLLSRQRPIVCVNYPQKAYPLKFVAMGLDGEWVATTKESTGLQSVARCGFGVMLIETEVFLKFSQPWFAPDFRQVGVNPARFIYDMEDDKFCDRAREAGYEINLDHDASKLVGHVGAHTWRWDS